VIALGEALAEPLNRGYPAALLDACSGRVNEMVE
jgi:hypothetical protein